MTDMMASDDATEDAFSIYVYVYIYIERERGRGRERERERERERDLPETSRDVLLDFQLFTQTIQKQMNVSGWLNPSARLFSA